MNKQLTVENMLEDLQRITGGTAHCDTDFLKRLESLLNHLDDVLGTNDSGKRRSYAHVLDLVSHREAAMADRERYPEIEDEVIDKPFIVAGMGRSGTTLMHALLGEHPDNRVPVHWEVVRPSPPPGLSPIDDPRIGRANAEVTAYTQQSPDALAAHPYLDLGGCSPIECAGFEAVDLRNTYALFYWKVPAMLTVNLGDDQLGMYEFERKMLQNLQYQRPPKRWALKGVHHHGRLTALKDVFPDSTVIWMHRDPLKVIPSMFTTLYDFYKTASSKPVDPKSVGEMLFALATAAINSGMGSPYVDDPSVCHVLYADFVDDQVGVIESIYDRYNLPFDTAAADAMANWLTAPENQGDRYGKWTYAADTFDLSNDQIEEAFGHYRERFDIPYE